MAADPAKQNRSATAGTILCLPQKPPGLKAFQGLIPGRRQVPFSDTPFEPSGLRGNKPFQMGLVGKPALYDSPLDFHYRSRFILQDQMAGANPADLPMGRRLELDTVPGNLS